MKEALIRKILSERLEEIYRHCKNVDKKFDKESIHNFRLSVKIFRSFLHLLSTLNETKRIKLPKHISRLYRTFRCGQGGSD
jgi:CHAD domain-containing protein